MKQAYGKLRSEDVPIIESAIALFKKHNLRSALHGTSLWNGSYKDVDLLVTSEKNSIVDFNSAFQELKKQGEILKQNGNENVGFDYEVKIKNTILHLSFVILL